jgi:DNA-binding NtrC family response regulator
MTTAFIPTTSIVQTSSRPEARNVLSLLIVAEDRFVREACKEAATALGYSATATESYEQAFWLVDSENIDVVFLAAKAANFISVLNRLKEKRPDAEVIAISNTESVRLTVDALKAGAYEVIAKPFALAEVKGSSRTSRSI